MANIKHCLGRFYIMDSLVYENYEDVRLALSEVVVVECRYIPHLNRYEYTAISKHFIPIKEGTEIPLYQLTMSKEGFVSFKNMDERE